MIRGRKKKLSNGSDWRRFKFDLIDYHARKQGASLWRHNSRIPEVLVIGAFLCDLFNLYLFNGIYPKELKVAMALPIYKKDSKTLRKKLPADIAVNKVLESYTSGQLLAFLKVWETGIGMINMAIDDKNILSSFFIDLSKAFDTVV